VSQRGKPRSSTEVKTRSYVVCRRVVLALCKLNASSIVIVVVGGSYCSFRDLQIMWLWLLC